MDKKWIILFVLICIMMLPITASARASDIDIDTYYNDQLYPGASIPKPLLKIGEPFTVRFDVTSHHKGYLSVKLTELGDGSFVVTDGPIEMETYIHTPIEENETLSFEWTLETTDEWAGGSMPLNFVYQLNDFDTFEDVTKGKFTAAYVTISEEYYDGPITTASSAAESGNTSSPTTPAFTALCAVFAMVVAGVYRRK